MSNVVNSINSIEPEKESETNALVVKINLHVGVFFDGTNNNANNNSILDWFKFRNIVEKNHVLVNTIDIKAPNISNPAILSAMFTGKKSSADNRNRFIHAYIEGSGSNGFQAQNKILDFVINGKAVKGLGFGLGETGVVGKVSKAIKILGNEIEKIAKDDSVKIETIHFYVFGFSRGSTCARLFSYIVSRATDDTIGILENKGFFENSVESEFDSYLSFRHFKNGQVFFLQNAKGQDLYPTQKGKITVDFLGIYDTVSAIGFLKEKDEDNADDVSYMRYGMIWDHHFWDNFHCENSRNYGLYSPSLANVRSTCHICAMDEYRANFALTDLGEKIDSNGYNIEFFLPGCHSDIGGGYHIGSKVERKTIKIIDNNIQTRFFNGPLIKSGKLDQWEPLNLSLFKEMGWIDISEKQLVKVKYKNNEESAIVFDHKPNHEENSETKSTTNIYSNITLSLMYERFRYIINEFGYIAPEEIFEKGILEDRIPTHELLSNIQHKLLSYINTQNGRFCYIPSKDTYRKLREYYLHFTCSDSFHGFGDLGNVPGNILKDNCNGEIIRYITRYVYRGGLPHDGTIHYMSEYRDLKIIHE